MKKYSKTHSSETALNAHSKKIEARGGKVEVNNMGINYSFPNSTPQVNENKIEKPAKISALMREYQSIRKQYPDAVIWFAIGGFVEAFSDSAEITAKVLGIPLVKNKNIEYPLAGFQGVKIEEYTKKMLKAGYRVALREDNVEGEDGILKSVSKASKAKK